MIFPALSQIDSTSQAKGHGIFSLGNSKNKKMVSSKNHYQTPDQTVP